MAAHNAIAPAYEAVIVGAGFGGMGAAIELKRQGIENLAIVERTDGLGGTWHVNHYPGLAVDIASVTYSYSFEPNPYWSRLFAPGAELKRYAEHVADKYDLRRHMSFGEQIARAEWDGANSMWRVFSDDGTERTARFLLTATGFLSQPHTPEIPGIHTFAGRTIHTTDWEDGHDVAGVRITAVEAQHFSGRGLRRDGTLWASWVLSGAGGRVFFSGDTGYFDGYPRIGAEHGPFDALLMAVGAYDPAWHDIHLDPEESVEAAVAMGGGLVLPIHWCTFVLAPHPWAEPVERLLAAADTAGVEVTVPKVGQRIDPAEPPAADPWWAQFDA